MSPLPHHSDSPQCVRLARNAMATRFELVLYGENPVALQAAGEEALEEIDRLEAQLSLYRPTSEIAHLNALAARQPVRVSPPVFALLEHARQLHEESGGAFDITIAPLVRCWGFMGGSGHLPRPDDLAEARQKVGMSLVELDAEHSTVRFARAGVMLDLGAIGKGYAIEKAAELLREAGVTSALLHGGTSTVYALGRPPEAECWKVAIDHPGQGTQPREQSASGTEALPPLATVPLKDEAMSVSGIRGKCFEAGGKVFGHILDPRSGQPAIGAVLAAVVLPSATETDALSTALLTLGPAGHESIGQLRPRMRTLVATENAGQLQLQTQGIALG
jgi:FAD:protein FMN transferase